MEKPRSLYWFKHWEERSKLEDSLKVSGWGSRDIIEYLCDTRDICQKLELKREDTLLNIGCGNGLPEIILSYWVKSITSIDFSRGMLRKARENNEGHRNVEFYTGNILDLSFLKMRFDKVLCNSVIQYLNSTEDIKKAFIEIEKVTEKDAFILISANPDIRKFEEFISGYDILNLKKEEIEKKKEAARTSLWTNPFDLKKIAERLGYKASIRKMHPRVWQSCYMYDLILRK